MGFEHVAAVVTACRCRIGDPVNKLLLIGIAHHADDRAVAFPAMPTLVKYVFLDERNIRRRLRQLEVQGLIVVKVGSGRTSSRYALDVNAIRTHVDGSPNDSDYPCPAAQADLERIPPPPQRGLQHPLSAACSIPSARLAASPQRGLQHPLSADTTAPRIDHRIDHRTLYSPSASARTGSSIGQTKPDERVESLQSGSETRDQQSLTPQAEQIADPSSVVIRSEPETRAAWDVLIREGGQRLASARTLTRDQWQVWARAWMQSGGQIEDCRIVGAWIARGGLDWLRKPKISHLASAWPLCLAQALEDPKRRSTQPTVAVPTKKAAWEEAPPPEAVAMLAKLGITLGDHA